MTAVDKAYRAATGECRHDYENLLLKMEIPNLAEPGDCERLSSSDDDLTDADAGNTGHDDVTPVEREPDCSEDSTNSDSVETGDTPLRHYAKYSRRH